MLTCHLFKEAQDSKTGCASICQRALYGDEMIIGPAAKMFLTFNSIKLYYKKFVRSPKNDVPTPLTC